MTPSVQGTLSDDRQLLHRTRHYLEESSTSYELAIAYMSIPPLAVWLIDFFHHLSVALQVSNLYCPNIVFCV